MTQRAPRPAHTWPAKDKGSHREASYDGRGRGPFIEIGMRRYPSTDCPKGCDCELCREWPWVPRYERTP